MIFFKRKFDEDFYLTNNPDVKSAGLDPYKHYLDYGKLEGRLPTADAKLPVIDTDKICKKFNFSSLTSIPIVIPTFNRKEFLVRLMQQLDVAALFFKVHVVIFDDGSENPVRNNFFNTVNHNYNTINIKIKTISTFIIKFICFFNFFIVF